MQDSKMIHGFWAATAFSYALVHAFLIPEPWRTQSLEDDGFFSYLTIALAFIALLITLKNATNMQQSQHRFALYLMSYMILIYLLREADFHRLFTDEHVTRGKFYTNPDISLQQKLFGGMPMLVFFLASFFMIGKYGRLLAQHALKRDAWAIAFFLWGGLLFASQVIDRSDFNRGEYAQVFEELLEVCAAGYAILAAYLGGYRLRSFDRQPT